MIPPESPAGILLLRMSLRNEQSVVLCRRQARTAAAMLGVDSAEQIRLATAVSEIARNAVIYAREPAAEFSVEIPHGKEQAPKLVISIEDRGPGIPHLSEVLAGRHFSPRGLSRGMTGANLLADRLQVRTGPEGTAVRIEKNLSAADSGLLSPENLRRISEELAPPDSPDPVQELVLQNQELLRTLEAAQRQREELELRTRELEQVTVELAETNRGVLALYDELDSLHRLGRVIASQINMDALLQAITDATTELSGAELGAFYHWPNTESPLRCQASSGILRDIPETLREVCLSRLFPGDPAEGGALRIDDLREDGQPDVIGGPLGLRSWLAVVVADAGGRPTGAMIFGHRLPHQFSERNERILSAVSTQAAVGMQNAQLYSSVQAASAAKDHFLATLSHELRTPLNPVFVTLAGLEADPELTESVRDDLRMMRRNLDLEARLIDDLLDMTRIVNGKISLTLETVDMHDLLKIISQTFAANAGGREVQVRLELEADRRHVSGDAARLQQVFWNLVHNAIKFTPSGGRIVIRTRQAPDEPETLRVEVEDNGRGIDPALLKTIFNPFEQGTVAGVHKFGGLGLGLAISRSVVEAHDGKIFALSDGADRGAVFVVKLHLCKPPVQAPPPDAATVAAAAAKSRPPGAHRLLRILLVDDHEDTVHSLRKLLTRRGHRVTSAMNSAQAAAMAAVETFDVVVSDIGLPDRSGLELMRELKDLHGLPGVALSGYGTEADIARSRAAGFYCHLTKPVQFSVLQEVLAQLPKPAEMDS